MIGEKIYWLFGCFREFIPVYLFSISYWTSQISSYATLDGFFAGLLLLGIVYGASKGLSNEENSRKKDMVKVLALMALVGSANRVNNLFMYEDYFPQTPSFICDRIMGITPICLLILCLVIRECYKESPKRAFMFGIGVSSIGLLINISFILNFGERHTAVLYFITKCIVVGCGCFIGVKKKYGYSSYLVFAIIWALGELAKLFIPELAYLRGATIIELWMVYKVQIISFAVITVIWMVFEKKIKNTCDLDEQEVEAKA